MAVTEVLRSDWLTTGPWVERFEQAVSSYSGVRFGVAISSGTAGLHACMNALKIGPGDEVIVPAITFAATANAVIYSGGTPIFADVSETSLLIDPESVIERITSRTRAIVAVDYAGQPCDYDELRQIATTYGLSLVADSCHAFGATYRSSSVAQLADLTVFSFHPVKHITTGEGGMVVTQDRDLSERIRRFRNHGITTDHRQRAEQGSFFYDMEELGFNYRLSDINCALGLSQLKRIEAVTNNRRRIAKQYDSGLKTLAGVLPLQTGTSRTHSHHLYVVRIRQCEASISRDQLFSFMRERGVNCNVHYRPVYQHSYYVGRFGDQSCRCPVAEDAYKEILSLPIFPQMTKSETQSVIDLLSNGCLRS